MDSDGGKEEGRAENRSQPEYVGFWARFVAFLIDSILIIAITLPIVMFMYGDSIFEGMVIQSGPLDFVISYVLPAIAIITFWVYKSATPGKMVISARIVDAETGERPSVKQCIIRYFGYYISTIPLCLGLLWVAWDRKKQGWHDKLAGTVVIRSKKRGS